jgi:peptide/nickel transport system substrate-binding protein
MRYLEYDPDRSNELLDEIGLEWDSSGDYRLRPDGKRLRVEIKAFTPWPAENVENSELIKNHWKELGIEAVVKPTDRRLWEELIRSAQFDVATYGTGYGGYAFPPYRQTNVYPGPYTHWATMWGAWLESDGREGVEPPAAVKRLDEIVDSIPATTTEEERLALYKETMKIHSDNLFQIGVVREPNVGRFFVMKKNVGNQTEYGNASWRIASYKFPYAWATYYFKD